MHFGDDRLPERFWNKVEVGTDGCWRWKGELNQSGYGRFYIKNKHFRAHRISYSALVGSIPEDLQIDHLCRVKNCVNPKHMELVTAKVNVERQISAQKRNKIWSRIYPHYDVLPIF